MLALALLACGKAHPRPPAAVAPATAAEPRPAPSPVAPWELNSTPAELDCEHHEPHFAVLIWTGGQNAEHRAGRYRL